MELFDTHAHLFMKKKGVMTPEEAIADARKNNVRYITSVALNSDELNLSLALAASDSEIFIAAGTHPHNASQYDENFTDAILKNKSSISLFGEIGLDYHYNFSPPDIQKEIFALQLDIARENKIPVMLHLRDAHADALEILSEHPACEGSVLHCYTSDAPTAKKFLDLGFYISFSGIVTFPNASSVRDALSMMPLDRILIETDAPFLAPVPFRGRLCTVSMVKNTADFISNFLAISLEKTAEITTINARKCISGL